jgi:hypothetical protein
MECAVLWDRNFELTVAWKKDNLDIKPDGIKFVKDGDNALTIKNLSFDDAGRRKVFFLRSCPILRSSAG